MEKLLMELRTRLLFLNFYFLSTSDERIQEIRPCEVESAQSGILHIQFNIRQGDVHGESGIQY
jgi:hypothetical protein